GVRRSRPTRPGPGHAGAAQCASARPGRARSARRRATGGAYRGTVARDLVVPRGVSRPVDAHHALGSLALLVRAAARAVAARDRGVAARSLGRRPGPLDAVAA